MLIFFFSFDIKPIRFVDGHGVLGVFVVVLFDEGLGGGLLLVATSVVFADVPGGGAGGVDDIVVVGDDAVDTVDDEDEVP